MSYVDMMSSFLSIRASGECASGTVAGSVRGAPRSAVDDGPDSVERFRVSGVSLEGDHADSVGAAGHDEVNGNTSIRVPSRSASARAAASRRKGHAYSSGRRQSWLSLSAVSG
jgi:hypothetical protein